MKQKANFHEVITAAALGPKLADDLRNDLLITLLHELGGAASFTLEQIDDTPRGKVLELEIVQPAQGSPVRSVVFKLKLSPVS